MKDNKETEDTANTLVENLKSMVREAEKLIAGSSDGSSLTERLHLDKGYEAATQKVSEAYNTAKQHTVKTAESTNAFVHEKPFTSIAIAVASGFITGLLVGYCGSAKKEPN